MKPRNREVSIFNMSVLDLLTGALGAFCFLTLALFPSYFKVTNASAGASQVSAADAAQAAKAAEELKGLNIKLKSELANVAQNQNGMPPFAMGYVSIMDQNGQTCGGFQITDYSGPGGQEAIKLLPTQASNGYDTGVDLFALAPGDYQVAFNAYANSNNCNLTVVNMGASGTNQTKIPVTSSRLSSYSAKFTVAAADLSFADVLKP